MAYQKRRKRKKRRGLLLIRAFVRLGILVLGVFFLSILARSVYQHVRGNSDSSISGDVVALTNVDDTASVTEYYTYGTVFHLSGTFTDDNVDTLTGISLILQEADAEPAAESDATTYELEYETTLTTVTFTISDAINEGVDLESISDGAYVLLLQLTYSNKETEYLTLEDGTSESDITYYTVTKDDTNQKISIGFSMDTGNEELSYLSFVVAESELPENVYDIVIDAGHGGSDTGALSVDSQYNEADLVLEYALDLKEELEDLGYKVAITRDGTESDEEDTAYTMYDSDGRVNVACATQAKMCICLHMNSNSEAGMATSGLQIYCTNRGNTEFAELLADSIVANAGTSYSDMTTYQVANGVYCRPYSSSDVTEANEAAASAGYDPYDLDTTTDYYYMIRELGGIATGAYVDGRNTTHGANAYVNSNQGVECFLVELGFITDNVDITNMLNNESGNITGITSAIAEWWGE